MSDIMIENQRRNIKNHIEKVVNEYGIRLSIEKKN